MTLMHSIVNDPVPSLGASAPPQIQAILERAMAKRPEDRYQSAEAFADDLQAAIDEARTASGAPTVLAPPPPSPARSRHTTLVAIAAAIIVAAGLAVAVALSSDGGGDDAIGPATTVIVTTEESTEPTATSAAATTALPDTTVPVLVVQGGEVFLVPFDESGEASFTPSIATAPDELLLMFVEAGGPPGATEETPPPESGGDAPASSVSPEPRTACSQDPRAWRPANPINSSKPLRRTLPRPRRGPRSSRSGSNRLPRSSTDSRPFVLTADTRVADHELVDGVSRPRQVVLQVGTAVMVDEFGAPTSRCASGTVRSRRRSRSRTAPATSVWPGTRSPPVAAVAVVPAAAPVDEFVLTDVADGPDFIRPVGSSGATDRPLLPGEVLATGSFTSFSGLDQGSFGANVVELIFRPEGGDVTGSFAFTFTVEGVSLDTAGDLTGTYDPTSGVIAGTGFGTTTGGGLSGSGEGGWTATVDPVAGTIAAIAGDNEATFDLTFTPYAT